MKVRALGFDFDASCVKDMRVLSVIEALSNEAMCLVESNEEAQKREDELASQLSIALEQLREHRRGMNLSFDSVSGNGNARADEKVQALTMSLSQANEKNVGLQMDLREVTSELQQQKSNRVLDDAKQHSLLTTAGQNAENLTKLKDVSQFLEKRRDELVSR